MAKEPYVFEFAIWNVALTDVQIAAASAPFDPINGRVEAVIWCPLTRSDARAIYALVMGR